MIPPQNVSESVYLRESRKRMDYCIEADRGWDKAKSQKVALVVLSCKRPKELQRLFDSLKRFSCWRFGLTQAWFVDNGSCSEVERMAKGSGLFTGYRLHSENIGIGAAINDVLGQVNARYVLFVEDDLVLAEDTPFIPACEDIFDEYPQVGIIKLKHKAGWNDYPYRRIGPMQTTSMGVRFHPWLPSPRWSFRWGQRPWYPIGIHNVWSLGPVMFRWCSWATTGPIPSGQGRGQAGAAEEWYARSFNLKWLAARPVDFAPFVQPVTPESPGFGDRV